MDYKETLKQIMQNDNNTLNEWERITIFTLYDSHVIKENDLSENAKQIILRIYKKLYLMESMNFTAILERIIELSIDDLNDWEFAFISDAYDRHVLEGKKLSDKQKDCILKINRKILNK